MSQGSPNLDQLAQLLRESSSLSDEQSRHARSAFVTRLEDVQKVRRPLWSWPYVASFSIALVAAFAFLFWPASVLRYQVDGAQEEGGYVRVDSRREAQLTFTDQSRVTAAPGARLRVVETRAEGAKLLLEAGSLVAEVTHTAKTQWNFVAGPFDVHVTGTKFVLNWDPSSEVLRLDLRDGSVEITGAQGLGSVTLNAGQKFVGDARSRTMKVGEGRLEPALDSALDSSDEAKGAPPIAGPDAADPDTAGSGTASTDEKSAPELKVESESLKRQERSLAKRELAQVSWAGLVARGQFKEVVAAAKERGLAGCMSSCASEQLIALADAARYTGQDGLASDSLHALRRRFSGGSGARAAFLLGRMYEGRGSLFEARKWYDTSLKEAPGGAFAAESLAGKMRTVAAMNGDSAARAIAEQYLLQYPQGVHESSARKILQR